MLDWFVVTCGGAALYAAGKWLYERAAVLKRRKQRSSKGRVGQPLKLVVAQCEARWFLQDLKVAMEGDAEAMVRVSHMLMAGYGTKQDHTAAAHWMRQAWAIQNYKEPAQLHDMLDVRDSDIPALNEARTAQQQRAVPAAATAAAAVAAQAGNLVQGSSCSGSSSSSHAGPGRNSSTAAGCIGGNSSSAVGTTQVSSSTAAKQCSSVDTGSHAPLRSTSPKLDQEQYDQQCQMQQFGQMPEAQQQRHQQQQQSRGMSGLRRDAQKMLQQQRQLTAAERLWQQSWISPAATAAAAAAATAIT